MLLTDLLRITRITYPSSQHLSSPNRQSPAIAAQPPDPAHSNPVHLSHILRHALAYLFAIGASYLIHIPEAEFSLSPLEMSMGCVSSAAAAWIFELSQLGRRESALLDAS